MFLCRGLFIFTGKQNYLSEGKECCVMRLFDLTQRVASEILKSEKPLLYGAAQEIFGKIRREDAALEQPLGTDFFPEKELSHCTIVLVLSAIFALGHNERKGPSERAPWGVDPGFYANIKAGMEQKEFAELVKRAANKISKLKTTDDMGLLQNPSLFLFSEFLGEIFTTDERCEIKFRKIVKEKLGIPKETLLHFVAVLYALEDRAGLPDKPFFYNILLNVYRENIAFRIVLKDAVDIYDRIRILGWKKGAFLMYPKTYLAVLGEVRAIIRLYPKDCGLTYEDWVFPLISKTMSFGDESGLETIGNSLKTMGGKPNKIGGPSMLVEHAINQVREELKSGKAGL